MGDKKREPGYYWVKIEESEKWHIAKFIVLYIGSFWDLIDGDSIVEINEDRLKPPDETT